MSKLAKTLSAAAGNAGGEGLYPEDVFSTYLYTGTASAIAINNGLDLSGEGGLTWLKSRSLSEANILMDTVRGVSSALASNNFNNVFTLTGGITAFNSNGFTLGTSNIINTNASTNTSWSFRKAAGFFDIVTYTGNGSARTIAHNLGSVPKMIIVKSISDDYNWYVYHASLTNQQNLTLDTTNPAGNSGAEYWNSTTATSSVFSLGTYFGVNGASKTYVAYVFGDDAIFGEGSDESICKIDSYTGNGSNTGPIINCGFEPQWILIKKTSSTGGNKSWIIVDVMRGIITGGDDAFLTPNETSVEFGFDAFSVTATGFQVVTSNDFVNTNGVSYIYMAIRRPMKVPTAGTEVFDPNAYTATSNSEAVTTGFPVDLFLGLQRNGTAYKNVVFDRLRTGTVALNTASADDDEPYAQYAASLDNNTGFTDNNVGSGLQIISYAFKRASKFFDMVTYTGTASTVQSITHNLTVIPEMIIAKNRDSNSTNWGVYHAAAHNDAQDYITYLNTTDVFGYGYAWANFAPTDTIFKVGNSNVTNKIGDDIIAYLFATIAGISKVGSVVHSGTTNVDCGFSAGARFVLVKRTDASGDWYVWDSVRGIVAGNDPYLVLNTVSVEVTNTDYIDPLASGFTLTSSFTAGTYIFLAIA